MALLEADGVVVRFGGNLALDDVAFGAEAGVITALIGPNGAGKTTLFNVMTGLLSPDRGTVRLDGEDISSLNSTKRARRGIGRTFQRLELFRQLTVRENIRVAAEFRRGWSRTGPRARGRVDLDGVVDDVVDRLSLHAIGDAKVNDLPTGSARLVELARAMAIEPRVLLLDEPASGQDRHETEQLATAMVRLAEEGLAVVLVEHDLSLVMEVCHQIHVLDLGRVIAVGEPDEVRRDAAVIDAYIGGVT